MFDWLDRLGYTDVGEDAGSALFGVDSGAPASIGTRPYAAEIADMLSPSRGIAASYVYCVGELPVVCFFNARSGQDASLDWLDDARQKLWNQGLVSVVIVLGEDELSAVSVLGRRHPIEKLARADAFSAGAWSASDFRTGNVHTRAPSWFEPDRRVDRRLLQNLTQAVSGLSSSDVSKTGAELLLAQAIFVRTLEERSIISKHYRKLHNIEPICELIKRCEGAAIDDLLLKLSKTFNGDLLKTQNSAAPTWSQLTPVHYDLIDRFLSGETIDHDQRELWAYDFSIIPVETISGIYESFLGDRRKDQAAYYTPRHLAVLAVEEAFTGISEPHKLRVFDGACGSGILLTTAFHRMLASAESARGGTLSFRDRVDLLSGHIFGGDIDPTACWLTAFSLYLCILDRLTPADVALLQEDERTLLPPLLVRSETRSANICAGKDEGDVFRLADENEEIARYDIVLSNPPWKEASGAARARYELWLDKNESDVDVPDGQIAAAFTHCAAHRLSNDGRMVLILPLNLLIGIESHNFRRDALERMRVERIYNFGDLRHMLFPAAVNACGIMIARPRPQVDGPIFKPDEKIEYLTPKAALSLSLGRITISKSDRSEILAATIYSNAAVLLHRYWGGRRDVELLSRLVRKGTIEDFVASRNGLSSRKVEVGQNISVKETSRQAQFDFDLPAQHSFRHNSAAWHVGKGFHATDNNNRNYNIIDEQLNNLGDRPYLKTKDLPREHPYIAPDIKLPLMRASFTTVATPGGQQQRLYEGPRVIWPNGLSKKRRIRASYADQAFAFQHTACALGGESADPDTLRFLTLYLRSSLATYLLIMNSYSLVADRWAVSKHEVLTLPFIAPEAHPKPRIVAESFTQSNYIFDALAVVPEKKRAETFEAFGDKIDEMIGIYFGLTDEERELISDASSYTAKAMQPTSYAGLLNALTDKPSQEEAKRYATLLRRRLINWRSSRKGSGDVSVKVVLGSDGIAFGAVRVTHRDTGIGRATAVRSDSLVKSFMAAVGADISLGATMAPILVLPDIAIATGDDIYIIKPMQRRCWLSRAALDDADQIVADIDAMAMMRDGAVSDKPRFSA